VQRAAGVPFADDVERELLRPLGMAGADVRFGVSDPRGGTRQPGQDERASYGLGVALERCPGGDLPASHKGTTPAGPPSSPPCRSGARGSSC
jgi:hypothetical protein